MSAKLKNRNWCLTSHHKKSYERWQKIDLIENNIGYLVFQEEKGKLQAEEKEPKMHVQGYVEMVNCVGIKHLRELFRDKGIHCEIRMGTAKEASDYCKKEETRVRPPIENGKISDVQGKRNDLEDMYKAIKAGKNDEEVLEMYPRTYMQFYKAADRVKQILGRKNMNDLIKKTTWLYKMDKKGNLDLIAEKILEECGRGNVFMKEFDGGEKVWWDGYNGEKILLIRNFEGEISAKMLKKICGSYKMTLEIKGGTTTSQWEKIYITSHTKFPYAGKKGDFEFENIKYFDREGVAKEMWQQD